MLSELLEQHRATILKRWLQLIVESYPPDSSGFLEREGDRFLNPVGYTLSREIEILYQELLGSMDASRLSDSLDNVVKIRAVQDFSPSQAVGFAFQLKNALREQLKGAAGGPQLHEELLELESRIDRVALLAFDLYVQRREKIHQIRTRELRERSERLLERMNRIYGRVDRGLEGPDHGSSDVMRGSAG